MSVVNAAAADIAARLNKFYNRIEKLEKNYAVHDPESACALGDKVLIESCRPISRTKRFKLSAMSGCAVVILLSVWYSLIEAIYECD